MNPYFVSRIDSSHDGLQSVPFVSVTDGSSSLLAVVVWRRDFSPVQVARNMSITGAANDEHGSLRLTATTSSS